MRFRCKELQITRLEAGKIHLTILGRVSNQEDFELDDIIQRQSSTLQSRLELPENGNSLRLRIAVCLARSFRCVAIGNSWQNAAEVGGRSLGRNDDRFRNREA